MIRLLRKILGLHEHVWKEESRRREQITAEDPDGVRRVKIENLKVFCACEICGEPRSFTL